MISSREKKKGEKKKKSYENDLKTAKKDVMECSTKAKNKKNIPETVFPQFQITMEMNK